MALHFGGKARLRLGYRRRGAAPDIWADDFLEQPGHDHRAVRGIGSEVRIDRDAGIVSKLYRPKKWLQGFYWLCFQGPFPYRSNQHALLAAEYRRDIAEAVLEYELAPGLVARPHAHPAQPPTFDSEYVPGVAPRDKKHAREFLASVTAVFTKAGLPTWQVAPWQPRAVGNLIERRDGSYEIIDLESNLVTPFVPARQLGEFLEQGIWPSFDDINLQRLRAYLAREREGLREALGGPRLQQLVATVAAYEAEVTEWRRSELRLPSKVLSSAYRGVRSLLKAVAWVVLFPYRLAKTLWSLPATVRQARDGLDPTLLRAIERWEAEGRLSGAQAERARKKVKEPEVHRALVNLAVHVAISVPLRFPIGSLARFAWSLAHRARAEWRGLRGRPDAAARGRSVHSVPVIVLSLVPGAGAFAYMAAPSLRHNLVLLQLLSDELGARLPMDAYRKLGLQRLSTLGYGAKEAHAGG